MEGPTGGHSVNARCRMQCTCAPTRCGTGLSAHRGKIAVAHARRPVTRVAGTEVPAPHFGSTRSCTAHSEPFCTLHRASGRGVVTLWRRALCILHFAFCILHLAFCLPHVPPAPLVFWLAGVKLAFHLLIIRGYGWFRDEFYYIACGERLDWGYVDHPPLVAVVTATTRFLLGESLVAIRLPAALAGAATIVVAGLLAHELGARRFGQSSGGACGAGGHDLPAAAPHPLDERVGTAAVVGRGAVRAARAGSRARARVGVRRSAGRDCTSEQAQHAVLRVRAARGSRAVACEESPAHAWPVADGPDGRGDLPAEHHLGGAARLADAGVHAARAGAQERGAAARGVRHPAGAGDEPRERRSCG